MKFICVPKNSVAQNRLNFNESRSDELIELALDDDIINALFNIGFFNMINQMAHSNIDIFEYESIIKKNELLRVLNSNLFNKNVYEFKLQKVIDDIEQLFRKAMEYDTGIYFYF